MSDLQHLLQLAARGAHAGASGGEKRACAIVRVVFDNAAGLDESASRGIVDLVDAVQSDWYEWRDRLNHLRILED